GDTRTLNKVEDVENYLGKLSSYKPQKASGKKFDTGDFDISVPSFVAGGKAKATPTKQKRHKTSTMIPAGVHCELKSQRIVDIFDELRKLRIDKFPNACAVMLRILLELSIGEYFEATKKIEPLL